MSMIMQYVRIRPDEFEQLQVLLEVDPDGAYEYVDELADADPDDVPPQHSRSLDTDKAWAAFAFLLDQVGPPVDVVHGGTRLTRHEWGYEPPRYLSAQEVATAAHYLGATPFDELAGHFDPRAMAEVYPRIWNEEADALAYLRSWYAPLTEFFVDAAAHREGIVVYLT